MSDIVALTAYDDHPGYRGWRWLIEKAWRRLGIEPAFIHVTNGQPDPDSIHAIPPDWACTASFAVYSRLWGTMDERFAGKRVVICDMDTVPLDIRHFGMLHGCPDDIFTCAGGDFFFSEHGQVIGNYFPACYCMAHNTVWREVLGRVGDIPGWLIRSPNSTSEAFLKIALEAWRHIERTLIIPRWYGGDGRRLCKSNWQFDADGLRAGRYIDIHLPLFGTVPQGQVDVIEAVLDAR